jgi:hypothetical protein
LKGTIIVMASTMSWERARLSRLAGQHLLARRPAADLLATVSDICGLHAQVMSSAAQSAAVRVDGVTPDTVRDALWRDRSLVKTWAMRGTLHLLPAAELATFAAALSLRRYDLDKAWLKFHGLTAAQLGAVIDAVAQALDGRQLGREELGREVVRITGDGRLAPVLASGWGSLLKPVAFQGRLCFGPSEGNRVTFVRPDQWIGGLEQPEPRAALQQILRRFLLAYGPATVDELARWWGAKPKLSWSTASSPACGGRPGRAEVWRSPSPRSHRSTERWPSSSGPRSAASATTWGRRPPSTSGHRDPFVSPPTGSGTVLAKERSPWEGGEVW